MSFMTSADQPHSSVLVFNSQGQVLVRKDNGKFGIPCTPVKEGEDTRAAAVRVATSTCLMVPTKMHPFFGQKDGAMYHTVFLVTHRATPITNPLDVPGNEWVHPYDLCSEEKSTNADFYKGMFSSIFKKVIPAVV